jgi:hypothetical protein
VQASEGGGWPVDSSLLLLLRSPASGRPTFAGPLSPSKDAIACSAKTCCVLVGGEDLINVMFAQARVTDARVKARARRGIFQLGNC